MEEVLVKKQTYKIEEEVNSFSYIASLDGKKYFLYDFSSSRDHFSDFKFALKRLKNCGVTIPPLVALDKKTGRAVVEYIEGPTPFDMLVKEDLDEKIIEQVFILNYKARINRLRLNFNPDKFRVQDGKLYYMPFTFTEYVRDEDFTQKEIKYWFYTKDFTDLLISKGIPVNKSRIANEYEQNKQMVLMVVKYFR